MSVTSTVTETVSGLTPKLAFSEILNFAYDTFCSNKVRFMLTGLGMVIGTASLILVVTIGLTGKQVLCRMLLAKLYLKMDQPTEAEQECSAALAEAAGLDSPVLTFQTNFLMGQVRG